MHIDVLGSMVHDPDLFVRMKDDVNCSPSNDQHTCGRIPRRRHSHQGVSSYVPHDRFERSMRKRSFAHGACCHSSIVASCSCNLTVNTKQEICIRIGNTMGKQKFSLM
jgi:hypothetical protein